MKRKIYNDILKWKNESNGSTALLIEGARRVGKSYIVEEFAKENYKSYILIDFSKAPEEVKSLFDNYLDNLNYLFTYLSQYYGVKLYERETLFIFDEIQFCPRARGGIKHLVADGRYDYIETGSLISIKKNVKDILIPSEEEKLKKEQYLKHYRRKEKTTGIDGNFLIAYNKKVGFKHRMFISYIRCSFCKY